jgi:peptidoglycan hydrolase-like protein with peptidoglycan-binding domain
VRTIERALARRTCFVLGVALSLGIPATAGAQTTADGGADPRAATKPATSKLGSRSLREGMHGRDVEEVQVLLDRLGFEVSADGQYGPATKQAVQQFEKADRIRVDGVVVRRDARRMKRAASVNAAGATGGAEAVAPLAPPDPEAEAGPAPTAPGDNATVGPDGLAVAPASAPQAVKDVIAAGNKIAKLPYRYGGGHTMNFQDTAYDCSGSVSFALKGANLITSPLPSGSMASSWGEYGPGQWITVYAHGGHAYMVVAGLRFDTSGRAQAGTRWQTAMRSSSGYTAKHPEGL